jgi:uncharacterized protein (DUF1778 family)
MTPGPGRPPSDNPRRNVVPVRLTDDERDAIRQAAEKAGLSISDYLRTAGMARAKRAR